jgi:t-SNARE complex subunit (syntaxin)
MTKATTRDADNLVGPEESRLPAAELEAIESQGQQINKMDEKLNMLEARILRLKRELDECKQKNELCEQFEDNSKKYAARLKADIKKDQQKVDSKKMKLAT